MADCNQKKHAIMVKNGFSKNVRKKNEFYNCAVELPAAGARSTAVKSSFPPAAGSAISQCTGGQKCYSSVRVPKQNIKIAGAKSNADCYCKCYKKGYYFAGWVAASKQCNCFNVKIKGLPTVPCSGAKWAVQLKSSLKKSSCCTAAAQPSPSGKSAPHGVHCHCARRER
ncbi:uncharacterized protein LOC119100653 [Pollicipes pollicipes]|uniref:uncharacterized protein LOC119100653 n=1 Tax=Pollicipes pollicipes TaxID=41117 RepID=UPI00188558AA|nr:uncharacterized protein LOC119100653 [Pollicipes pollicipes]